VLAAQSAKRAAQGWFLATFDLEVLDEIAVPSVDIAAVGARVISWNTVHRTKFFDGRIQPGRLNRPQPPN